MDHSDSENEGQLLIDESVDASKRGRGVRKRGAVIKKPMTQRKKRAKLVAKSTAAPKSENQKKSSSKEKGGKVEAKPTVGIRASTRTRKRVRKHSPSPVRQKKEPPKKKLKVKIKHVAKVGKKKKPAAPLPEPSTNDTVDLPPQDIENVDIESISDDELQDIQYSSVIVNEDPAEKAKISAKPKKKGGIKLKLSLGKVLTPKVAESLDNIVKTDDGLPEAEFSTPTSPKEEKPVVKPLIISKRRVSSEMSSNDKAEISVVPTGNASPYYSSSSEDHKPLTLRLSVGRPKIPKRSISAFEKPAEQHKKPFHNIQRSWSVTPSKDNESHPESALVKGKSCTEESTQLHSHDGAISTTPYFSAGLQSLLDVVSVEINEQNRASTGRPELKAMTPNVTKHPTSPKLHLLSNSISPTFQRTQTLPHGHEGHLPSMAFPKPEFHFSSKKRPRQKSLLNTSQPMPDSVIELENSDEVISQNSGKEDLEEPPDHVLNEKERRRRDKKKILNDDFVDPDSIMQCSDVNEKRPVKKRPLPTYTPKSKGIGFSLLMPQMKSQPAIPEPKSLETKPAISGNVLNRNNFSRRPKKGMATAKQRLASKLKIGRSFAH